MHHFPVGTLPVTDRGFQATAVNIFLSVLAFGLLYVSSLVLGHYTDSHLQQHCKQAFCCLGFHTAHGAIAEPASGSGIFRIPHCHYFHPSKQRWGGK